MSDDDLTLVQRCTLVVLMDEARKVPNTELGFPLKAEPRDKLAAAGLIEVDKTVKPMTLELTDKGWRRAIEELSATNVPKTNAPTATRVALYATLRVVRRFVDRSDLSPQEFFVPPLGSDMEARIRKAYAEVAPHAGDWVMLNRLRAALGPASRAEVDAVLVQLSSAPDVQLIPESNQKVLTAEERAAAVSIGNQDNHLIAIGS